MLLGQIYIFIHYSSLFLKIKKTLSYRQSFCFYTTIGAHQHYLYPQDRLANLSYVLFFYLDNNHR